MNKFVFAIAFCGISAVTKAQVKKPVTDAAAMGYNISITLLPYKNTYVYIGSYYGKGKTLTDSAFLNDKSTGVFKGTKKLTPGIYFVVSPQYSILFELLMDSKQHFSVVADTAKKDSYTITGSVENDLFKSYTTYSAAKGARLQTLNAAYVKAKTKDDSAFLREEIVKGNKELQDYRNSFVKQHPTALLTAYFNAMKQPEIPAIPIIKGKPDSAYPYHFVKEHFWDDVNFNDDRLLRTPFFEPKVDDYLKRYVSPEPDSVYKEIKYMLLMARTGKEMYPYLLTKFTNKYMTPDIMGQDKVFLKLFEDFYAKGDTTYLNTASRKTITERYYSILLNQIGSEAPPLALTDTLGKMRDIYTLNSKFVFVAFWDPTCGHCKEEIPRLDSLYKAKWNKLDVQVYSVNVNEPKMDEWKKFIAEKKLSSDWIQAYQTKAARNAEQKAQQPNFRQLYDMYKTPTFYLLDDKKHIIAKQLSIMQFDDIIAAKLKK